MKPPTTTLLPLLSFFPLSSPHPFLTPKVDLGPYDPSLIRRSNSPHTGSGLFSQLISHSSPSLGTFSQRYWYSTEFYSGLGHPIIVFNPGEQAATNFDEAYLSAARLPGRIAEAVGGAVVVIEHRYYGESSPYRTLTEENLQYLTLENALRDMQYFAREVEFPFEVVGGNGTASGNVTRTTRRRAPWVYTGGSYAGSLAGWLSRLEQEEEEEMGKERAYWAYYGSSAVVEAIGDFWQYFVPVLDAMPANCTRDVERVVVFVDGVLNEGTVEEKEGLKGMFGLGRLSDEDFAAELSWGLASLQMTQFYSEKILGYSPFYRFCDYVEGTYPVSVNATVPGEEGVGLQKALDGYARYIKDDVIPGFCARSGYDEWQDENSTLCFQNTNASSLAFTDLSVANWGNRQWWWLLCNEPFEWWQTTPPASSSYSRVISNYTTAEYWKSLCPRFFPNLTFDLAEGKTVVDANARTGGWDAVANMTRTMHTNGDHDPWRDATLSSKFRPGGPVTELEEDGLQVRVVKGGSHCSDLIGLNWDANTALEELVSGVVDQLAFWVGQYYEEDHKEVGGRQQRQADGIED
ncbi:putative serine protease [Triangularia setosa]|uniref:Serine protease n=1 Tax=Triangularia setosa TaxID=2587417 RepID=A0AAN6W279_9PEZI|nr:putative serine protease [Podospora setosa]